MTTLPEGWNASYKKIDKVMVRYRKTFEDGTDVTIEIRNNENYEVWSIAAHRVSGPDENFESSHTSLDLAIKSANSEMIDWDKYFLSSN